MMLLYMIHIVYMMFLYVTHRCVGALIYDALGYDALGYDVYIRDMIHISYTYQRHDSYITYQRHDSCIPYIRDMIHTSYIRDMTQVSFDIK